MSQTTSETPVETAFESKQLDTGDLHAVLAHERRRIALDVLSGESTPVDGSHLARAVAARERDTEHEALAESTVHEVHVLLYHVHLPKLAEADLVEYDADDDTVVDVADAVRDGEL